MLALRHARFYTQALERAVMHRRSRPGEDAIAGRAADISNIRAALIWCFRPDGDAGTGIRLAAAAAPLYLHLSLLAECDRLTGLAAASAGFVSLPAALQLELLAARSVALRYTMGNSPEAHGVLEQAIALAEQIGDVEYLHPAVGRRLHLLAADR